MHVLPHLVLLHNVFLLINRRKMITLKIDTPGTIAIIAIIAIIALVSSFDDAVEGIDGLVAVNSFFNSSIDVNGSSHPSYTFSFRAFQNQ